MARDRQNETADDEPLGVMSLEGSLEDVEAPENLPAGIYTAEIVDVQKQTSQKGNTYFAVSFLIPPSEYPSDFDADNSPDGVQLYWNRVLVPRGAGDRRSLHRLKMFVKAIGLDTNVSEIDPNDWMGQRAKLKVRIGKYQGEERPEIASVEVAEEAAPARTARKAARK